MSASKRNTKSVNYAETSSDAEDDFNQTAGLQAYKKPKIGGSKT